MLKRFLGAPLCLFLLGLLLAGCNFFIHAENTPPVTTASVVSSASPGVDASAASSPGVDASVVSSDTPVTDASAVAPAKSIKSPSSVSAPVLPSLPEPAPDAGMRIVYNVLGHGARTITGRFPATPGFALHISCRGNGFISVELSSGVLNSTSCPQQDDIGNYYTDPVPSSFYTIQIKTQGSAVWRVVIEDSE